jgi:hypothetical protein
MYRNFRLIAAGNANEEGMSSWRLLKVRLAISAIRMMQSLPN